MRFWKRANPMPEYESVVAEAMNNLADAIRTHAAATCLQAAAQHVKTLPDQIDQGDVFYALAKSEFELDPKLARSRQQRLDAFVDHLCKGKK